MTSIAEKWNDYPAGQVVIISYDFFLNFNIYGQKIVEKNPNRPMTTKTKTKKVYNSIEFSVQKSRRRSRCMSEMGLHCSRT